MALIEISASDIDIAGQADRRRSPGPPGSSPSSSPRPSAHRAELQGTWSRLALSRSGRKRDRRPRQNHGEGDVALRAVPRSGRRERRHGAVAAPPARGVHALSTAPRRRRTFPGVKTPVAVAEGASLSEERKRRQGIARRSTPRQEKRAGKPKAKAKKDIEYEFFGRRSGCRHVRRR